MERNDDNIGNLGGSANTGGLGSASNGSAGLGSGSTGGLGNSGDLTGSAGYGSAASTGTSGSYGASGSASDSTSSASPTGNIGSTANTGSTEGMADRARDLAGGARERLADTGATLRDRAGTAKNSLADMLEAGANRLNSQGSSTQLAGATGTGSVAADSNNRLAAVAGGLQGSADWLREADLDGMREGIENQVRTNPGRSLLLAVGLGYLVGKAFRR